MKFFAALLGWAQATHFRAVGYNAIQGDPGEVLISRTFTYRRAMSGYSGGCTAADVSAQTPSSSDGLEACTLNSDQSSCGPGLEAKYVVTDIEDSLGPVNNYCYGYKQDSFTKPAGPYTIKWEKCCWVDFTNDVGTKIAGGAYGFTAVFYDVNNNSPQVKIPPIWKILSGCPAQTIDLSPVDLDGDTIKCRWATQDEGRGAYRGSNYNSLTLDQNTCIVTYDGLRDLGGDGVKPIAIMVEDFDAAGNIRSSVPVQFLATVWSPTNSNFNQRRLSLRGVGKPFVYDPFFEIDDDEHTRGKRQAGGQSYCNAVPTLVAPSPAAGSVLDASNGITINVKAQSSNGAITRFQYNSPIGMTCGAVDSNGQASCTFSPSSTQQGQVFNFCFVADDAAGLSTERRCVSLNVGSSVPVPATTTIPPPTTTVVISKPIILAPAESDIWYISTNGTTVTCRGMSSNGPIVNFKRSVPAVAVPGMTCDPIANDEQNCKFTPVAAQYGTSIQYCFTAIDSVGAESDRRCFYLTVQFRPRISAPVGQVSVPISGWSGFVSATSLNGQIVSFAFDPLAGMTCSSVTNGASMCTFAPSTGQLGTSPSFCFSFEDNVGENIRDCVILQIASPAIVVSKPTVLSPAESDIWYISTNGTTVTCRGMSSNGPILNFKRSVPAAAVPGMTCDPIANDEQNCKFIPVAAQYGTTIQYCFTAIDSVGAESDRRCFYLRVRFRPRISAPVGQVAVPITGWSGYVSATSVNGQIASFAFDPLAGMTCSSVTNGASMCTFSPSNGQLGTSPNFCFEFEDNVGETVRDCVILQIAAPAIVVSKPTVLSPAESDILYISTNGTTVTCRGMSSNGPILNFKRSVPAVAVPGMTCDPIANNEQNCNFIPNAAQYGTTIQYCFTAVDSLRAESDRRCFYLRVQFRPQISAPVGQVAVPISGWSGYVSATSLNGQIVSFAFDPLTGMTCSSVTNGASLCTFAPSNWQFGTSPNFCFSFVDNVGETIRNCVILQIASPLSPPTGPSGPAGPTWPSGPTGPSGPAPPSNQVTEIFSMIKHAIPSMQGKLTNYGCTGVGNMDAAAKNLGKPVDDVDKALNIRKRCINCIQRGYTTYQFNESRNRCGKFKILKAHQKNK